MEIIITIVAIMILTILYVFLKDLILAAPKIKKVSSMSDDELYRERLILIGELELGSYFRAIEVEMNIRENKKLNNSQ